MAEILLMLLKTSVASLSAAATDLPPGKPEFRGIKLASPAAMKEYEFAAGSMGPKVEAACQFAELTGKAAAIGALADLPLILEGTAGTTISGTAEGIDFHDTD